MKSFHEIMKPKINNLRDKLAYYQCSTNGKVNINYLDIKTNTIYTVIKNLQIDMVIPKIGWLMDDTLYFYNDKKLYCFRKNLEVFDIDFRDRQELCVNK